MIDPEQCRLMSRYNRWMNERFYDLCAALSEEDRKADRGAPFRSIHGTLNHLLLADRVWLGRFLDDPFRVESLSQELYADFDELRAARKETDDRIDAWVAGLTPERLAGPLRYVGIVVPEPRTLPLWFAASHFFNHQTHHRGQLSTLLEQAGCDIGVTDLLVVPGAPTL
ncbi:MAG: DinB family protein [Armatimonadota bacterium]